MLRPRSKLTLALVALGLVGAGEQPAAAFAAGPGPCPAANVTVGVAPPPRLRAEHQPPLPRYGQVWTPGYWGWNAAVNDYYWAPGVWVRPPRLGVLWTPGYWGFSNGLYHFNVGSWGPTVGFYGGINYGYGYGGNGYQGAYWRGRTLYYNRSANNIGGMRINAIYNQRIYEGRSMSRVSYSGGPGRGRVMDTHGGRGEGRDARGVEPGDNHRAYGHAHPDHPGHGSDQGRDHRAYGHAHPDHPGHGSDRGRDHGGNGHGNGHDRGKGRK